MHKCSFRKLVVAFMLFLLHKLVGSYTYQYAIHCEMMNEYDLLFCTIDSNRSILRFQLINLINFIYF